MSSYQQHHCPHYMSVPQTFMAVPREQSQHRSQQGSGYWVQNRPQHYMPVTQGHYTTVPRGQSQHQLPWGNSQYSAHYTTVPQTYTPVQQTYKPVSRAQSQHPSQQQEQWSQQQQQEGVLWSKFLQMEKIFTEVPQGNRFNQFVRIEKTCGGCAGYRGRVNAGVAHGSPTPTPVTETEAAPADVSRFQIRGAEPEAGGSSTGLPVSETGAGNTTSADELSTLNETLSGMQQVTVPQTKLNKLKLSRNRKRKQNGTKAPRKKSKIPSLSSSSSVSIVQCLYNQSLGLWGVTRRHKKHHPYTFQAKIQTEDELKCDKFATEIQAGLAVDLWQTQLSGDAKLDFNYLDRVVPRGGRQIKLCWPMQDGEAKTFVVVVKAQTLDDIRKSQYKVAFEEKIFIANYPNEKNKIRNEHGLVCPEWYWKYFTPNHNN